MPDLMLLPDLWIVGMNRRGLRRCSRPLCLLLVCLSLALHLLLALFSLSLLQTSCDPPPPPDPRTKSLRALADANFTPPEADSPGRDPGGQGGSSPQDASRPRDPPARLLPVHPHPPEEGPIASLNMAAKMDHLAKSVGAGLPKLTALFSHPLYNLPRPALHEDDWLLKVKPKAKGSNTDSMEEW